MERRTLLTSIAALPLLAVVISELGDSKNNQDDNLTDFNVKDYGAKTDAVVANASIASGSSQLKLTSGGFTSADVGKSVAIRGAGITRTLAGGNVSMKAGETSLTTTGHADFTSADVRSTIHVVPSGDNSAVFTGTIVKVVSASSVELNTPAPATVSDAVASLTPFLTSTIASVSSGVATLVAAAGATLSDSAVFYGTDDASAINHAMRAAAEAGGGTVFFPPGNYLITSDISLDRADHILVRGKDKHSSILYRVGTGGSAIFHTLSKTKISPLTNFSMSDLTIDGAYMQGEYNVHNCGVRAQFLSQCTFRNIIVQNTLATGLGTDFLTEGTSISNVEAHNCGAGSLGGASGGGCAGIGIGTGQYPIENFTISECHADGNGTYGIFIETETGSCSAGMKITDCSAEGNGIAGFCDAGGAGAVWSNCISKNNAVDGFQNSAGSVVQGKPGQHTIWSNCVASSNGSHGFSYSPFPLGILTELYQPNPECGVSWHRCKSNSNDNSGWFIDTGPGTKLDSLTLATCESFDNGCSGVLFVGAGDVQNLVIDGGSFRDNGRASGNDQYGIHVDCGSASDVTIKGTRTYDDGADDHIQTYGVALTPGSSITNIALNSNDFRGNKTGPVAISGNLAGNIVITNNVGYNP